MEPEKKNNEDSNSEAKKEQQEPTKQEPAKQPEEESPAEEQTPVESPATGVEDKANPSAEQEKNINKVKDDTNENKETNEMDK